MGNKVLVLTPYYQPGFKAGGPIRSITNLVSYMSEEVDFDIITPNHDLGDTTPYKGIKTGEWLIQQTTRVLYVEAGSLKHYFRKLLKDSSEHYSAIYLNSFFHPVYSILPLILNRISSKNIQRIVLAPRGEFSDGALALRSTKKRVFITLFKTLKLYKKVIWHASSDFEKADIIKVMGEKAKVVVARNVSIAVDTPVHLIGRKSGPLKIVFLARIARMKNLLGAIESLTMVKATVSFDIFGPKEDEEYWEECLMALKILPDNIQWNYHGALEHNKINSTLLNYDLFYLPTEGENYGHAIVEAFTAGLPVLISDKTPWNKLDEKGIGWDIPLDKPVLFAEKIDWLSEVNNATYEKMSEKAIAFAKELSEDLQLKKKYLNLFKV